MVPSPPCQGCSYYCPKAAEETVEENLRFALFITLDVLRGPIDELL
jgi:hypothetical protein